jgi:hypothetical protein
MRVIVVAIRKYPPKLEIKNPRESPNLSENSYVMITFSGEPKGVSVEAKLIQIVIPNKNGEGLISNSLQANTIMGIKIMATDKSSIIEADNVDTIQIK